jgi:hypothetical protein
MIDVDRVPHELKHPEYDQHAHAHLVQCRKYTCNAHIQKTAQEARMDDRGPISLHFPDCAGGSISSFSAAARRGILSALACPC